MSEGKEAVVGAKGTKPRVLLVILSTIVPTTDPLTYSSVRSVYSPQHRLEQTLGSVASVRQSLPHATILVCDNSKTLLENTEALFKKAGVTHFFHLHTSLCNSQHKSHGEASCSLAAYTYIKEKGLHKEFDYMMKLSGRYWLDANFREERFYNKNVMTFYKQVTVLYCIDMSLLEQWKTVMQTLIENPNPLPFEETLYKATDHISHYITTLGASGHIAVNGGYWSL